MPAPLRKTDELGFQIPATFDEAGGVSPKSGSALRQILWRWRWWLFVLLILALFSNKLITLGRQMVAQRFLRQAEHEMLSDNLPKAIDDFSRSIDWQPEPFDRWEAYCLRGQSREQMQNLQGSLTDFNSAIELLSAPAQVHAASDKLGEVYLQRAWLNERLANHQEAIADATSALALIDASEKAKVLNLRAYIRALAGLELDQGLDDIQQAIKEIQQDDAAFIDTRGYLQLKLGKYPEALADLQKAIQLTEKERLELRRRWFQWANQSDDRLYRLQLREYDRNLGTMYHHRGEIYEKQKDTTHAQADFMRAQQLGFDPTKGVY